MLTTSIAAGCEGTYGVSPQSVLGSGIDAAFQGRTASVEDRSLSIVAIQLRT